MEVAVARNVRMTVDPSSPAIHERDQVTALGKGLAIIEMFDESRRLVTISEAANATGITRAAARRYLLSLVQLGYAFHDGKYFSLTPRVMRLGHAYLRMTPYTKLLNAYVEDLGRQTGEASTAALLEVNEAVVVAHTEPVRFVSMSLTVGTRLPLYWTAVGRVFLAFGDRRWAEEFLEATAIAPRTAKSLSSKAQFREALEAARVSGFAVVDEEMELGLRSLAVPICNNSGQLKAALNIAVNASKYTRKQLVKEMLPHLRKVQDAFREM